MPAGTLGCLSCGADVGDETVIDDIRKTALGGARRGTLRDSRCVVPVASITSVTIGNEGGTRGITSQATQAQDANQSADPPPAKPPSDPTTTLRLDTSFIHLVPGTLVGEYEVEKLLGSGGMGAVYGARHERLRKKAAIKVIAPNLSADQSAVERFEQEALALAQLSHPNIVAVLSIGTLPGDCRSYYTMEWLDGATLHDCLEHEGVPLDAALDILDQIARGLDAAHAAGIVHRDLKPANCWLQQVRDEPRRVVKILDFGLAKPAEHRRTQETAVNVMFGTPDYMSPEQCRSTRDVGPATDVYALGCIGYELLCGRLPFTYDNAAELVVAHGTETPPTPRSLKPAIPAEIDALLTRMLAKDPSHRPTLAQVRGAIAAVRSSPAIGVEPSPHAVAAQPDPGSVAPAAPVDEPQASRRALMALAGLVVLGATIVAAIVGKGGAKLRTPTGVAAQPRATIEIDANAPLPAMAPSLILDASAPRATPAPRSDAGNVAPRTNSEPASPPAIPVCDGGAREPEPAVVVEPEPKTPAIGTAIVDASIEPSDGAAPIAVIAPISQPVAPVSQPAPSPPNRAPAATTAATTKRRPDRDVIVNPFKKEQAAK